MKKRIPIIYMILGVLTASSVMAGPLDKVGEIFTFLFSSIGSLAFLGGNSNQFLGFIRILYAILVFTILYAAGKVALGDKIPRQITITISIILSIIVTVFTPTSILLAISTSYATAVAFILLGGLIGGLIYFIVRDKTDSLGSLLMKSGLIILLFWILAQFADLLTTQSSGFVALGLGDWESFALTFFEWIYVLLVLLIFWVIGSYFSSRSGAGVLVVLVLQDLAG